MKQFLFTLIAATSTLQMSAQQIHVDFESPASYRGIGVYDTWSESPFRTGKLKGNAAVVANFTASDATKVGNKSKQILGVQRSRFGSNTFGVRVDLPQTFELIPEVKYVHVKMYNPQTTKVMLVGLGKRTDRPGQSADTEQFWVYAENPLLTNQWCDAVFPIKGNGGIEIHSLVFVPDCNSPHALQADFTAYIDDIEVSSQNQPRINATPSKPFAPQAGPVKFVTLTAGSRNGYLTDEKNGELTSSLVPRAKSFVVKAHPAPGFKLDYLMVRYTDITTGKTVETRVEAAKFAADGSFTIPAEWMSGNILLEGQFASTEK